MRIINLIENTEGADGCAFAHGLSFYVETEKHKLLLDLGPSGETLQNARQLGIDLASIDTVILSHGHYDHSGDVVWLTQETIDAIAEKKKLESDIRAGIANGEFRPFYQPKVNSKTGKLCGAEALTRWFHNDKMISPGVFIPIMEANDTVCLLDFFILKTVCADIASWLEEGIDVPVISVNCSRRNLTDPNLAHHIDQVVQEAGIPKNLIEIEVTESSDEFSIGVLSNFVDALHELGYKVSIDDFGSVSSSLTLLREVSFDTLKIDKGFVDNVNDKDIAILTYIVKLAREIRLDTVAEGVEQRTQIEILNDLYCDVVERRLQFQPHRPVCEHGALRRCDPRGHPHQNRPVQQCRTLCTRGGDDLGEDPRARDLSDLWHRPGRTEGILHTGYDDLPVRFVGRG